MSEHLDWFDRLDIDDVLDVGHQTARDMSEQGPGYGIEPTRYSRSDPADECTLYRSAEDAGVIAAFDATWTNVTHNLGMTAADIEAIAEQAGRNWAQMVELMCPIEPADTPGDHTP